MLFSKYALTSSLITLAVTLSQPFATAEQLLNTTSSHQKLTNFHSHHTKGEIQIPKLQGKPIYQSHDKTYTLRSTKIPFERALVATSQELKDEWLDKLNFLHDILEHALTYALKLTEPSASTQQFDDSTQFLSDINRLKTVLTHSGYLPETLLHCVYTNIAQV